MKVYLLLKHPTYPYNRAEFIRAGEVMGVYGERTEPARIASEKNANKQRLYFWTVQAKRVKEPQQ